MKAETEETTETKVLVVEPTEGQTSRQAWNSYFAKYHADPADVRETVRVLMKQKKADEVVAVIEGCLQNNQSQDWMFEGILLAMQIAGSSKDEIARRVMTVADFSDDPEQLMSAAYFLTRNGMEKRAISLLQVVADENPTRHEPYAVAMRAALSLIHI